MSKQFESENRPDKAKKVRPEVAFKEVFQSMLGTAIQDYLDRTDVWSINKQTVFAKQDPLTDAAYAPSNIG